MGVEELKELLEKYRIYRDADMVVPGAVIESLYEAAEQHLRTLELREEGQASMDLSKLSKSDPPRVYLRDVEED